MTHPSLGPGKLAPDVVNGTTYPGVVIRARPVGLLKMHDDKGKDVHSDGWAGIVEARAFVRECIAAYQA